MIGARKDLRKLDFDDLFIISSYALGYNRHQIADYLKINESAIRRRMRKFDEIFGGIYVDRLDNGVRIFTKEGFKLAAKVIIFLRWISSLDHSVPSPKDPRPNKRNRQPI